MFKQSFGFGFGVPHMSPLTSNLSEENKRQLCSLLGDVELNLLFKASVHGYNASAFHQQCDRQGPTMLVAYNHSGYIFGGYTSIDYAQTGQQVVDNQAFLFSFQGGTPVCFRVKPGSYARQDDAGWPVFGQQLHFCHNNQPLVYNPENSFFGARSFTYNAYNASASSGLSAFSFDAATLYGNNTQLSECEVYNVKQRRSVTAQVGVEEKPWRNVIWTTDRRRELMEFIRNYKLMTCSVSQVRILMIGPVGAGKSSFFNSINSIFMGRMTSKAMSGSTSTSLTTQFRTYTVKDGREGKQLPLVLCDTMGLEEQSGAGLDIEDISSILQGHIPDRYKFNPMAPFQPDEQKASRPASLQEKIHCVVYVIDATKISLMSDKLVEKLATIRKKVNSLSIAQIVLMTKVDEACPLVEKNLQNIYTSSYIKTKVQEVSSRLGVPVSCVLPVKNYSQELELDLNCDILLLTAVQQMLNFADDYLDDICPMDVGPF